MNDVARVMVESQRLFITEMRGLGAEFAQSFGDTLRQEFTKLSMDFQRMTEDLIRQTENRMRHSSTQMVTASNQAQNDIVRAQGERQRMLESGMSQSSANEAFMVNTGVGQVATPELRHAFQSGDLNASMIVQDEAQRIGAAVERTEDPSGNMLGDIATHALPPAPRIIA